MHDRQSVRLRCRAAHRLADQIGRRPKCPLIDSPLSRLNPRVEQLRSIMHRWAYCRRREWSIAADVLELRAQRLLGEIPVFAADTDRFIRRSRQAIPTYRDLIDELEQLELEFDDVRYSRNDIRVTTDPIELDDVHLGPFEIQLPFEALAQTDGVWIYRVIATDPNPPASNDSVTHPHVQDHRLCEGEAMAPIQQALRDGRVCDFFILVRSVLQTYNPSSAYVSLDEWHGVCCGDCGEFISQGNGYYCTGCDANRCDDCIMFCNCCDDPFCAGCVERCTFCETSICSGCSRTCPGCCEMVCPSCLESCCHIDEEETPDVQEAIQTQTVLAAG